MVSRLFRLATLMISALVVVACGHATTSTIPQPLSGADRAAFRSDTNTPYLSSGLTNARTNCGTAIGIYARCLSLVRTDAVARTFPLTAGFGPNDLQSAYKLPSSTAGTGQTVGVVDAFDDPTAETDLAMYRSHFGLSACSTAGGCFTKVNQQGNPHPLPPANSGWSAEISLGLDMVSAICPNCKIVLVEADDSSAINLGKSVGTAARLGADAISTGFAMDETGSLPYEKYYNHPGHMIVAAAGDVGGDIAFPASSPDVTAVGGTTLTRANNKRGWIESVFGSAAAGCSKVYAKPPWQKNTGCAMRAIGDVAAVADPSTGVTAVFAGQFVVFGGTSVASPIIAGAYALAGNSNILRYGSYSYSHLGHLFNVQGARDSQGFDGSTGNGTPNGIGAF